MAKLVWLAMPVNLNEIRPSGPLFKFLSLADQQSPTWEEKLGQLLEGKAYFPSPSQFNDPFDCLPSITLPTTIDELKAKQHRLAARFEGILPGLTKESAAESVEQLLNIASLEEIRATVQNAVEQAACRMGVFSLAQTANSVLMWSHYASNHTGIAVRFDWRRQQRGGLMPLFKVRYEIRRPSILSFFDDRFGEDADDIADALRTKAEFWRYEQEWRSIAPNMARKFVDFDPSVIDGIVLGANCSEENEEWIREKVRDRRLPIMRAFPSRETYSITFATRVEDSSLLKPDQAAVPLG